ncbi:GSCOCG00012485001-RA-CDS, partial [Cotesia congregata]
MSNIRLINSDEESISTSQDSLLDPSTETLSHTPISSHQTLSFSLPPSSEIVEPPEIIKPPENTVTATQMSFEKISSTPLTPTASTMQNMMKNEFAKLHARIDQAISTQIVPNKHLSLPERPEWVTHFADRLEDVYRLLKTNSKNIAKLEARLDQRTPDTITPGVQFPPSGLLIARDARGELTKEGSLKHQQTGAISQNVPIKPPVVTIMSELPYAQTQPATRQLPPISCEAAYKQFLQDTADADAEPSFSAKPNESTIVIHNGIRFIDYTVFRKAIQST